MAWLGSWKGDLNIETIVTLTLALLIVVWTTNEG